MLLSLFAGQPMGHKMNYDTVLILSAQMRSPMIVLEDRSGRNIDCAMIWDRI